MVELPGTGSSTTIIRPPLSDARLSLASARLDDLFPEGDAFHRSIQTYAVLLALAAFIASFGLYQDSVAAIIGAMVVAPLGGAIMAFAGALVTARSRWQVITFLQIVLGGLLVVAIGYAVGLVTPDPLTLNPSLDARTSPGLLDLGVALAAGAAGAYVAARRTGSDALPGVAIAVSLVPPLATVGICLELGRFDDAGGALILFLTNFSAIVVVACIVFVLAGYGPRREEAEERHRFRNSFLAAVISLAIIAIPLAWTSFEQALSTVRSNVAAPIVRDWIGGRDLRVTDWSASASGTDLTLELRGSDPPPDVGPLAASLAKAFGAPVQVHIGYTAVARSEASAAP